MACTQQMTLIFKMVAFLNACKVPGRAGKGVTWETLNVTEGVKLQAAA